MHLRQMILAMVGVLWLLTIGVIVLAAQTPSDVIAFTSTRDGNADLYLLDISTGVERRLTDDPTDDIMPAWSPDGEWLAFESWRDGGRNIHRLHVWHGTVERISPASTYNAFPTWSPNGDQITYISWRKDRATRAIYSFDLRSQVEIDMASPQANHTSAPVWSPDGRQLVFQVVNMSGFSHLYLLDVASGTQSPLLERRHDDQSPAWSPDGAYMAFASLDRDQSGSRDLYRMRLADGTLEPLIVGQGYNNFPAWSPDGERLVFSTNRGGQDDVYLLELRTGKQRRLTHHPADDYTPAWMP